MRWLGGRVADAEAEGAPASLESLEREVRRLGQRVTRIETRLLRWGAVVVLGAEAARLFLAPLVATWLT